MLVCAPRPLNSTNNAYYNKQTTLAAGRRGEYVADRGAGLGVVDGVSAEHLEVTHDLGVRGGVPADGRYKP